MIPKSKAQKLKWKQQLKATCIDILQQRINTSEQAMNDAQDSANNEDKSSAGDKYETSRAMGQLDRDMNAKQMEEAQRQLAAINSIATDAFYDSITTGSVVVSKDHLFFISLGLGSTVIDKHLVVLLSPHAPVASAMMSRKSGEKFAFNGKQIEILDVF